MKQLWSPSPRRKGVSTVIGAAIFILIFTLAVSAMMVWTQSFVNYVESAREEAAFQIEKNMEELMLTFINSSGKLAVIVRNPTPQTIIVTQVWSNHSVQTGEWVVPAKSRVSINTALDYAGMTFSKVVTSRGNVFSGVQTIGGGEEGGELTEEEIIEAGRWFVQWYNLSARRVFDTKLGESYWESLSITFAWGAAAIDPIFGPYTQVGFNATTRVVALGSKMYINYYVNEEVRVIVRELGIDSGWNTGTGYIEAEVSPGGIYTITILYSRWTGIPYLTLNFGNVDFTKLLTGG
ncbi:MAG: hypothetical protein H5T34_04020 [Candidatus Methanomethyliales bacterium]|nr:hypothetical protein [Candidatus Methanomethylicales archaeon]